MLRWLLAAGALSGLVLGTCAAPASATEEDPTPAAPAATSAPAPVAVSTAQPEPGPAGPPVYADEVATLQGDKKDEKDEKKDDGEMEMAAKRLTITATTDGYYEHNFNDPFNDKNQFHVFDIKDDRGPHWAYGEVAFDVARKPWGFRLDLAAGPTARLVNAFEPSDNDIWEHLQQVYLSMNLNRAGTRYVDFGKWVTMHGAEVIEARDNWLYSRGILFGFAIPFYHTGLRAWNYFNDTDYFQLNVTRGWNNVVENNDHLLYGASGLTDFGDATFILNYMGGREPDLVRGNSGVRHLVDAILRYDATERLTFMLNGDWVTQSDFKFNPGGRARGINWKGLAGYATYLLGAKHRVTLRSEVFNDPQGVATGFRQTLSEVTLGYGYRINKYAEMRLEGRRDWSNRNVFRTESHIDFKDHQDTALAALILSY